MEKAQKEPKASAPEKPPTPTQPYFRICAVGGTDGIQRPEVIATAKILNEEEWAELSAQSFAVLGAYIRNEPARRKAKAYRERRAKLDAKIAEAEGA